MTIPQGIKELAEVVVDFDEPFREKVRRAECKLSFRVSLDSATEAAFPANRSGSVRFSASAAGLGKWMTVARWEEFAAGNGYVLGGPRALLDLIATIEPGKLDGVTPLVAIGRFWYQEGVGFGRALARSGRRRTERVLCTMGLYPGASVTPPWNILLLQEL